ATTGPVLMPRWSLTGPPKQISQRVLRSSTRSSIRSAARRARSGSSSCATGAPNTAMTASPTNFSTKPPYCSMTSASILNRSFWNARTSAGSSRSLSDVKPETSANRTVTRRRSASPVGETAAGRATGTVATTGGGAGAASRDAPHFGQKTKSGSQANPHAAQFLGRRLPHLGQKAKPGAVKKPHAGQLTEPASAHEVIPEPGRRRHRQLDVFFE